MNIEQVLTETTKKAVKELYGTDAEEAQIQIQGTRKEFEGDFTLVVFPFVKIARKAPEKAAQELGEYFEKSLDLITSFNVVKGFLNLSISDDYWKQFLSESLGDEKFGYSPELSKSQVMVEYSSPNTNKPLHLGHLRNNFLGFSVAEILKAYGHDVVRVQIINDRGIHICKSMVAWLKFGEGETPETSGTKGDKLVGKYYVLFDKQYKKEVAELVEEGMSEDEAKQEAPIQVEAREMLLKWEKRDPEVMNLWNKMNGWVYKGFEKTYTEMGVEFDKLYYESDTYLLGRDEVLKGLDQGVLFKKEDGSVWCDLTPDGLDEKLVLRKDGTAVYMTQDIGTAILRFRDYPNLEKQIYTVGNEQEYHFKVLFHILEKLGFERALNNYHLSYGMVELPEGKMKSREGTVVDADDLLEEMKETAKKIADEQGKLDGIEEEEKEELYKVIGYGALKYFLLRVDPKKNMLFNPLDSVDFAGNTGPFIQYGYVRTRAVLRKWDAQTPENFGNLEELPETEKNLIKKIHSFPAALAEAANSMNPSHLANFTFDLVKDYNAFYQSNPILHEQDEELKKLRIGITEKVGQVIKAAMKLLGIHMPERM
ncbi:arginine--tRNA ligase [Halocola ammonii]